MQPESHTAGRGRTQRASPPRGRVAAYLAARSGLLEWLLVLIVVAGPLALAAGPAGVPLAAASAVVAATLALLVAGHLANDLVDREVDRRANPARHAAGASVGEARLRGAAAALVLVALGAAAVIGRSAVLIVLGLVGWGGIVFSVREAVRQSAATAVLMQSTLYAGLPALAFAAVGGSRPHAGLTLALVAGVTAFGAAAASMASAVYERPTAGAGGLAAWASGFLAAGVACAAALGPAAGLRAPYVLLALPGALSAALGFARLLRAPDEAAARGARWRAWHHFVVGVHAAVIADRLIAWSAT